VSKTKGSKGARGVGMEWNGMEWNGIPFHSIPFHSIPFHSIPKKALRSAAGKPSQLLKEQVDVVQPQEALLPVFTPCILLRQSS
jgi:hypothetical protein